ncbi:hypothetical protein Tco_0004523 [Tanacetum coccineum]
MACQRQLMMRKHRMSVHLMPSENVSDNVRFGTSPTLTFKSRNNDVSESVEALCSDQKYNKSLCFIVGSKVGQPSKEDVKAVCCSTPELISL